METSILKTIKPMVDVDINDDAFDTDLIVLINSALMELNQIGVGPEEGFEIEGDTETWNDYLGDTVIKLSTVKSYIYLTVALVFNPPNNSFKVTAMKEMREEYSYKLKIQAEGVN